ncbi:MAG: shikimate dehydrogenase [Bacteroidales bacterium]|jgi:shikimate dehydrogenase|nr:shikimate dehydrogenase [Bacteroidales bacterium]
MQYYGLIGHPLSHSFSKAYFEDKFRNEALDCFFVNFDIERLESIKDIIIQYPDLQGFTTTHPYKKAIFQYLSFIDRNAKEIGAVNVVKIDADKKLHGYNTDYIGFQGLLEEAIEGKHINKAYICGTGGASEAVKFVLKNKGISFEILSRKDDSYQRLNNAGFHDNELIINATPVGMYPNSDGLLELPYATANSSNVFIDLIYNPEETMFMKEAKKYGASAYNGLKMLKLQAEAAWRIWSL